MGCDCNKKRTSMAASYSIPVSPDSLEVTSRIAVRFEDSTVITYPTRIAALAAIELAGGGEIIPAESLHLQF